MRHRICDTVGVRGKVGDLTSVVVRASRRTGTDEWTYMLAHRSGLVFSTRTALIYSRRRAGDA